MRTRVIYADPSSAQVLARLDYEELGRVDNGVWVDCPDATVRALAQQGPPLFLYFDRRDYDAAVAELTGPQVQEVIRRRRDRWTGQSGAYVMAWLVVAERASLEAALGAKARPGVERSLAVLQCLEGLDRYQMAPAKAMAVVVLEGDSLVLACIESALTRGSAAGIGEEDASFLAWHAERRRGVWAQSAARLAVELGAQDFSHSPPYADATRGVFVHPADRTFERALVTRGEDAVRWGEGVVCASPERRFAELAAGNRKVQLLYADASEFYSGSADLTRAQLYRDFAARQKYKPSETRKDMLGQIDRLQLHQILMKRALCQRPEAAGACGIVGMSGLISEETAVLGRALERSHSFQEAGALADADIGLFLDIGSRYWTAIAPKLKQVEMLKSHP